MTSPSISVIIPTRDRAESLRLTLECLAAAERGAIAAEVVIVDNGSHDNTREVAESFHGRIPIRYLYEQQLGTYGKAHALNFALGQGNLGDIIVVLDDDMNTAPDWFTNLAAVCERWPDKDIFSGSIEVVWPYPDIPTWAQILDGKSEAFIFSRVRLGDTDSVLEDGHWYSGNHFWFRSRVLQVKPQFKDIWLTEPDFQLDLTEAGLGGVADPKVRAGHRIQEALLQKDVVLKRAKKFGTEEAWLRLSPYREKVKQARLLHSRPWMGRAYCVANLIRWRLNYLVSYFYSSDGAGFNRRLDAVSQGAYYSELLRVLGSLPDYRLWGASDKKGT